MAKRRDDPEEPGRLGRRLKTGLMGVLGLGALALAYVGGAYSDSHPSRLILQNDLPNNLDEWLSLHPVLHDKGGLRRDDVTRTARTSLHLVQIGDTEPEHLHRSHDVTFLLLRGRGDLLIYGQARRISAGDSAIILAGQPYRYSNYGGQVNPALIALSISPPFDGKDYVVVGNTAP